MNKDVLREFKRQAEESINNAPGCENYVSAAKKLAGDFEYFDLTAVILAKTTQEVREYVQMVLGITPNSEMSAVMIPYNFPNADGTMEIAAMVLVGYDAADAWNLDDQTKNRVIESLFVHELTHVKQLLSMGLEKFNKASFNMVEGANMNDYLNNVLEKEAYAKQNEYLKKHNVDIQFGVGGTEGFEFKCSIIFPKFN